MSVIKDNVSRLDSQLDRIQQQIIDKFPLNNEFASASADSSTTDQQIAYLQNIIHTISITSKSQSSLRLDKLSTVVAGLPNTLLDLPQASSDPFVNNASDLIWLLAAKAAVQTLALVTRNFLERTLIIGDEIIYWDEVSGSSWYSGFHILQTSPIQLWQCVKESSAWGIDTLRSPPSASIAARWAHFHSLIQQYIKRQSPFSATAIIQSPFVSYKMEFRRKRKHLKAMKNVHASSIGLLVEVGLGLSFETDDEILSRNGGKNSNEKWHSAVLKSVALMETILRNAATENDSLDFEKSTTRAIEDEIKSLESQVIGQPPLRQPIVAIERLVCILKELVPNQTKSLKTAIDTHGRPPRLVRYWLPLSMAALSASTFLRILTSRRAELIQWVCDIGSTTIDFWSNWVLEPVKKLIGTIRHDEQSEIAIMSKTSLEADRASLERMVLDFVLDHRRTGNESSSVTDMQLITRKVKEGDLTPVLKAYERDLRTPFIGTVRGDLIRALLIQVQKTKVDVELAMSGIDALLKSQELVFGFVGLTPGILVSYTAFSWVCGLFGSRRGLRVGKKREELRRALRNVDRTLTLSSPDASGLLSYRDYGLLVYDTEVLLQRATVVLRGAELRELREDVGDLINLRSGIEKQLRVVRRMTWPSSKWH